MTKKTMDDKFLWNVKILEKITNEIIKHRELRFNQILYNLGIVDENDTYYKEPKEVYENIINRKD